MPAGPVSSLSSAPWVDPTRRSIYDRIQADFEASGLCPDRLLGNPSYFRVGPGGTPVALEGSHPTVVQWPLGQYEGGARLVAELGERTREIDHLVGDGVACWISQSHWHSTVFSPVHSSDPDQIREADTNIADIVREQAARTQPYEIVFTRIVLTTACGILAAGYCQGPELDRLRARLQTAVPHGSASALVHVSLGNFLGSASADIQRKLRSFSQAYREDHIVLGRIWVDSLTYAIYHGPFTRMRIDPVFRAPLGV